MFAGLKGSDIHGRWYSFMQEHLVRPVCAEFRHALGLPTIDELPLTQNESDLVLGVNSRIFYLAVLHFIYLVATPATVDELECSSCSATLCLSVLIPVFSAPS